MNKVTVVGLGLDENDITISGAEAIAESDYVIVKTKKSRTFGYFEKNGIKTASCDALYNNAENFDALNDAIAERIAKRASTHKNVVFCVNGSGYDDASVAALKKRNDVGTEFIPGVSNVSAALSLYPCSRFACASASEISLLKTVDTDIPLIITEVYDKDTASEVKLALFAFYKDDHPCFLVDKNGARKLPLHETDLNGVFSYDTALLLPPLPLTEKKRYTFSDLLTILRVLRGDNGCEWDKAQTHESIRHNAVEEAYELSAAIDENDPEKISEEAGDLLLQAVFHAEIARETCEFDVNDMLSGLCAKLIFRHTHIFGQDKAASAEEALKIWEKNKLKEKSVKTVTQNLTDVPRSMAALMRAQKVQHRAAKAGFDWKDKQGAVEKIFEEIKEVTEAVSQNNSAETEKELGDLLFALVNVCRFEGVDPEIALTGTTERFIKRFSYIENELAGSGKTPYESTLEEMDALWNEAKKHEKDI